MKPHLQKKSGDAITVTIDLKLDTGKIAISQSLNLKTVLKAMVGS